MTSKSALLYLSLFFLLGSCSRQIAKPFSKTGFALGTTCTVTVYEAVEEAILEGAFNVIARIENLMSISRDDTELSEVNRAAGKEPVVVSRETYEVVKRGLEYSKLSHSRFDISIGPLVLLWGIGVTGGNGTENQEIPRPDDIEAALSLVDYRKVVLEEAGQAIFLQEEGMILDLGGIAKGYAADMVAAYLQEKGVSRGIVNLGGNILAFGEKQSGEPWKIGVQDPASSRGKPIGIVPVRDKAVVTSGVYERYFEVDGKRYHHILDTDTGFPVENNLLSVTIVSHDSITGDAWSTIVFSLGLHEGFKLIEETRGVEGILITGDNRIHVTSGLQNSFTLVNSSYQVMEQGGKEGCR